MTYSELVAAAPPGASHFGPIDLARLPPDLLGLRLAVVPESDRLLLAGGDREAGERVVRALFWTLVYQLEPDRWDELSRAEPIHPGILDALPADGARVLEVGAGTGRLTANLALRARTLIAVEPATPLREILHRRMPEVAVLDALAQDLPIADDWAELTVACASFGPDPACLSEMERCTRPGGTIALVSPEEPEWFESHGWKRISFDPREVVAPPHSDRVEAFFGPLDPPHELLIRRL